MGFFNDYLVSRARDVNPRFDEELTARDEAAVYQRLRSDPRKAPVSMALELLRSGNRNAMDAGESLYSDYQSGKPADVKIFDYLEQLTPDERARWMQQNAARSNEVVHSTFKGNNGNMWIVGKDGRTLDTGVPFQEDAKTVTAGGVPYDPRTGKPIVDPDQVAANRYQIKTAEGDAEREQTRLADQGADLYKINNVRKRLGNVQEQIDKAINQTNLLSAGFLASDLRIGPFDLPDLTSIGGMPARDLKARLDTIKSVMGFAELQQMRDESKTGGALGQVTEQELVFLQSAIASLDQAQNPIQLKEQLNRVKQHIINLVRLREAMYQMKHGEEAPMLGQEPLDQVRSRTGGAATPR